MDQKTAVVACVTLRLAVKMLGHVAGEMARKRTNCCRTPLCREKSIGVVDEIAEPAKGRIRHHNHVLF